MDSEGLPRGHEIIAPQKAFDQVDQLICLEMNHTVIWRVTWNRDLVDFITIPNDGDMASGEIKDDVFSRILGRGTSGRTTSPSGLAPCF